MVLKLKFDNLDKRKGMDYVLKLGNHMQLYKPADILKAEFLLEKYDEDFIKKFVESLDPSVLRISLKSRSVEELCTEIEPIYNSKYAIKKFDQDIFEVQSPPPHAQRLTFLGSLWVLFQYINIDLFKPCSI